MVEGFAGFGFPKAHSAAFGLLAYQSTWLRVHYGAEFLCALLNEQPMGFYAPDSLVHEAEQPGDRDARPRRERLAGGVHRAGRRRAPRSRLRQGRRRGRGVRELVAERERGGPYRSLGELAARSGVRRGDARAARLVGRLRLLAARGAPARCGAAAVGERGQAHRAVAARAWPRRPRAAPRGTARSSRCRWSCPHAPRLRPLGRWQRLIADYSTSGVTIGDHAMAILRERLTVPMLATSAQLARLPSGCEVAVAGLVIARQRPGTANGTMFLLFEDEFGTINLIVPRAVYERHRQLARAEPLLLARGRSSATGCPCRSGGLQAAKEGGPSGDQPDRARARAARALSLRARSTRRSTSDGSRVHRLRCRREPAAPRARRSRRGREVGSSMRAAAPPMQSFAIGPRR